MPCDVYWVAIAKRIQCQRAQLCVGTGHTKVSKPWPCPRGAYILAREWRNVMRIYRSSRGTQSVYGAVRWGSRSESKSPWGNSQTPLPQLILSLKISSWQINVPEGRLPRDRNASLWQAERCLPGPVSAGPFTPWEVIWTSQVVDILKDFEA